MEYLLPANNLYGNAPVPISFPDDWEVHVCSYAGEKAPALSPEEIAQRLSQPGTGGCRTIAEDARGSRNAVIIFDDITRPTPCEAIAKAVIVQLEEAGIPRREIRFVCALGGHRGMGRQEFVRKLGEDIVREFEIYNHNPFFNNVKVGDSAYGYPVELNSLCVSADYTVGIGALFPHPPTGVGGGPKLILPGIASAETIRGFHTGGTTGQWDLECDGRKKAVEATRMLGLRVKIDVLLNGRGEIAQVYYGDADENTRAHIDEIHQFFLCHSAGTADLVISNNYFKPSESSNAILPGTRAYDMVRDGGDVVLSSHTPLGTAQHYMFGWWGGGGGLMYKPKSVPPHIRRHFAFYSYPDHGTDIGWQPRGENVLFRSKWADILAELGTAPRKVIILPYALVNWFDPPVPRHGESAVR